MVDRLLSKCRQFYRASLIHMYICFKAYSALAISESLFIASTTSTRSSANVWYLSFSRTGSYSTFLWERTQLTAVKVFLHFSRHCYSTSTDIIVASIGDLVNSCFITCVIKITSYAGRKTGVLVNLPTTVIADLLFLSTNFLYFTFPRLSFSVSLRS